MKIHLVKKTSIEQYAYYNANSRNAFRLWLVVLKGAEWNTAQDILNTYSSADLLGNGSDRVVFNIGGNNYRMICHYTFGEKEVHLFICWIGTHAEYTKLCAANKQYMIRDF